jgi:sialidase-1
MIQVTEGRGWLFFALAILIAWVAPKDLLAQPTVEHKLELFPSGMNGVHLYRIPGVVITAKGTLIAYCEARRNSKADWGEIEVHLRRSLDGGRTWSPATQIAHKGNRIEGNPRKGSDGSAEQTVNNPVAIVDRQTGSIEFLYCINYARCFSMRSLDDGLSWSEPVEITEAFKPFRKHYDWKVIATGPGHGIQLKSGRLVVPIWMAYGNTGDHAPSAAATIYSDDHGKTWLAGDLAVPNEGAFGNPNETIAAELSDGRVMLVTRNVSKPNRKLVTIGPDGASGWSKPEFHTDLYDPICMSSVLALREPSGSLIFTHPYRVELDSNGKEVEGKRGKRENLTIRLSHDNGKTWSVDRVLDPGKAAYSDLVELSDGRIGCLYEGDRTIWFTSFSKDWITGN